MRSGSNTVGHGWNSERVKMWLKKASEFLKMIFSLIHITYGQPARGEELIQLLLLNTRELQRNFYWSNNTVMMVTHYNKTRSVAQKDQYIARFLPRCVAEILLQYLVLARPLAIYFASILEPPSSRAKDLYTFNLFVDGNLRLMTGLELRQAFVDNFKDAFGTRFDWGSYRQIAIAFGRMHIKDWPLSNLGSDQDDHDDNKVRDLQAGHS